MSITCYKIFTLFEDIYKQYIESNAPLKRGIKNKVLQIETINFRNYAKDKHKKVDDILYGGGPGLLLKPDVLVEAVEDNVKESTPIFMLDPQGEVWNQGLAQELASYKEVAFVTGRYEGFDARVKPLLKARSISLGDFILTNGDLALLVVLDSVIRLINGTCDSEKSSINESFSTGLLEEDQYTRPAVFRGLSVPSVLKNGNHHEIEIFKKKSALKNSLQKRPDLVRKWDLNSVNLNDIAQIFKEIYHVDEYRGHSR
jgi:tRNA (guanine37-N1)-methyltransferase